MTSISNFRVLVNSQLTQNLVSTVFCQFRRIKVRLGRRPLGYGLTSRLSTLTRQNWRALSLGEALPAGDSQGQKPPWASLDGPRQGNHNRVRAFGVGKAVTKARLKQKYLRLGTNVTDEGH